MDHLPVAMRASGEPIGPRCEPTIPGAVTPNRLSPHVRLTALPVRAPGGAGTPAVIQGFFLWRSTKIDSAELARATFERSRLGNSKVKPSQREQLLSERWAALQDMADSPELEGRATDLEGLKTLIATFANAQKVIRSGVPSGLVNSKGGPSVSVSTMKESGIGSLPKELQELVEPLLKSGRAFPEANILKTAKLATGAQGHGFFNELLLAYNLMEAMPLAMIQVGVVPPIHLADYLGFEPVESIEPVKGFVGGDIAVWHPPSRDPKAPKTTFIQAKTANRRTLRTNVLEAGNQLASLTASGNPVGKWSDREFTMTGDSYEGAIFVSLIDADGYGTAIKVAGEALSRHLKFISKVVIQNVIGREYLLVTKDGSAISKTNPLIQASPVERSVAAASRTSHQRAPFGNHDIDFDREDDGPDEEVVDDDELSDEEDLPEDDDGLTPGERAAERLYQAYARELGDV